MRIHHNINAMNLNRHLGIITNSHNKAAEKLSTGYRVNRAADDAAVLSISEKMRNQIRGLHQGIANVTDGISWVQTAEGALGEVTAIMHRMKELTVMSLNDTWAEEDRAMMQAEFDHLQSEIDKISKTTKFNTQNVFEQHESTYYAVNGNRYWVESQHHTIEIPDNTLTFEVVEKEGMPPQTVTITVPPGSYTTQELIDEIDDAMMASGAANVGLNVEYTDKGLVNVNYESGEEILNITGGLSYLLYDSYNKGSLGSLLGTTLFSPGFPLEISNQNNYMEFKLMDFYGNETPVSITLPNGWYDKQDIIDILNNKFAGMGLNNVEAKDYGTESIQITSEDYFVTGLKGNMFKIDDPAIESVYTSVFYDNIKYGSIKDTYAYFKGGAVLTTNASDTDHNRFIIDDSNNTLKIQANGQQEIAITIADGSYTASSMAIELNRLFGLASINLTATFFTEGTFQGIRIDSGVKGIESEVAFNTAESNAYNTLFRETSYATLLTKTPVTGRHSYGPASLTGGVAFEYPLSLADGENQFRLTLDGDDYTITVPVGTYNSLNDLLGALDNQINGSGAPLALRNRITVTSSSGRIRFEPAAGSEVINIGVSAVTGNSGYQRLFVGSNTVYTNNIRTGTGTNSTPPEVVLEWPFGETMDGSNNRLVIVVDGVPRTVTVPGGSFDPAHLQDIMDAINLQITSTSVEMPKPFPDQGPFTGTNRNGSASDTGEQVVNVPFTTINRVGTGQPQQGSTQPGTMTPAEATIPVSLPPSVTITTDNHHMSFTVNGNLVNIYLEPRAQAYTREELVNHIQEKLNGVLSGYEGVDVTLDGDRLHFKTRRSGDATSLGFNSGTIGSFIRGLCTTQNPAAATLTSSPLNSSIVIDSTNRNFSFNLNGTLTTVQLTAGTYDRSSFINMLNNAFGGLGVTASLSGNNLRLTTTQTGTNASVAIDTQTVGNSAEAVFGPLLTSPSATIPLQVQGTIMIDGSSDQFNITIDGTPVSIALAHGTYTPTSLLAQLNSKLSGKATVSIDSSNRLTFTTVSKGTGASIALSSSNIGNSSSAIFGTDTVTTSGVTASMSSDGTQLILTGTESGVGKTIRVSSADSAGNRLFLPRGEVTNSVPPTVVPGSLDARKAAIQGAAITEPVTITGKNKSMSFTYGGSTQVSIHLAEGDWAHADLQQELQDQINAQIGTGKLVVRVDSTGVLIEAAEARAAIHDMTNFSGGFYRYVIAGSTINKTYKDVLKVDGEQIPIPAYAIGRQDVRNQSVEIIAGSNDALSLDITIDGTTFALEMTLDPGVYQGEGLARHVQNKINEALVRMGLQPGMIRANIGGYNSGVAGSNDNNALIFSLAQDMILDREGEYIIDGVSGSAAFYIFYKTEGFPIPAYIKGTKDISGGVEIKPGKDAFSFAVDGVTYTYTIPEGEYTADEIVDELNRIIGDDPGGPPVLIMLEDGNLKISHTKFGDHKIDFVSGPAKGSIFYEEGGRIDEETDIIIQASGTVGNSFIIGKPRVSTISLGINSVAITAPKYANKALDRIDVALKRILSFRSYYGARQNRMEHVVDVNAIEAENLQESESRMRDTDIAKGVVEYAKQNILKQAVQSLMAQANRSGETVLSLLK